MLDNSEQLLYQLDIFHTFLFINSGCYKHKMQVIIFIMTSVNESMKKVNESNCSELPNAVLFEVCICLEIGFWISETMYSCQKN